LLLFSYFSKNIGLFFELAVLLTSFNSFVFIGHISFGQKTE